MTAPHAPPAAGAAKRGGLCGASPRRQGKPKRLRTARPAAAKKHQRQGRARPHSGRARPAANQHRAAGVGRAGRVS